MKLSDFPKDDERARVQCPYCNEWLLRKRPLAMFFPSQQQEELISTNCEHCDHVLFYTATLQSHKSHVETLFNNGDLKVVEEKSKCSQEK
jgi:RNase P subunit RPR2